MEKGLPRHEIWRKPYRENRYCRHLTQKELNQRINDLVVKMLRLTTDAKIGLPPLEPDGMKAMEVWTHALEEMVIRHGPYPNGFTKEVVRATPYPDLLSELGMKATSVLASTALQSDDLFVKFGKTDHMRSLFERGALRVQCASYYSRPNHNNAVKDDELSLPLSLAISRDDIINIVVNPKDVPSGPIEQRIDATYLSNTDYWLYCVSSAIEPRLFVDFEADSCVIIKDKDRFQRLITLQSAAFFPSTAHCHGKVSYVDPLRPTTADINIPMSKHFRYEYQHEYRFVWKPLKPVSNLPYIDLELGSLESFSELVVL
jgi:hypothetical protein